MSLATSPTRPHLEYAVRLSDSPYKLAFAALQPGDEVLVCGPIGDFVLHEMRPAILIAGGIGMTPLKAWPSTPPTGRCPFRSSSSSQ
jgi:glycine betaine catabolism B